VKPEPKAEPVLAKEEPQEPVIPVWVTTVLRGGTSSTQSFPLPPEESEAQKNAKTHAQDKPKTDKPKY
jgi:hypothetical protein